MFVAVPVIVMGDFNNLPNSTSIAEVLATGAQSVTGNSTEPTHVSGVHIDYIFYKV